MMFAFRLMLVGLTIWIYGYTTVTIYNHGWNLVPIFFGDMAAMTWPGQFNADFMCFLLLSGLWLSWRHRFSVQGILLGFAGVILGISLLAPYLLYLTFKTNGHMRMILLGEQK